MSRLKTLAAMWPRILAASVPGAVMIAVCPPVGVHHLMWIAFVPLLWALRPGEHRKNALLGWWAGGVMLALNFAWLIETVNRFTNLPFVVSFLVLLLFAGAFSVPYLAVFGATHLFRQRWGLWWVALIPTLQVTNEKLSPALFPYYLGAMFYRDPYIWQVASVFGVTALTWLAFFATCALGEGLYRRREGRPQPWALYGLVLALIAAGYAFGAWRYPAVEARLAAAPTLRAAIMQQDVTMEERLEESHWKAMSEWYKQTRNEAMPLKPDLVVWPEGAVVVNPDDERAFRNLGNKSPRALFQGLAQEGSFDLLIGGGSIEMHDETTDAGEQRFTAYNSCYSFSPGGEIARYDKMVPLPFGEYMPLSDLFPFLKDIIQGPGDFQGGDEVTVFTGKSSSGLAYDYTTPICYEAILARQMWKMRHADLFVNITNDAWFGDTQAPHQHAQLAAVQPIELGRPMLRIAYTGISFIVEPHGRIVGETEPFTHVTKVEEIRMAAVETAYRRGGWLFPWILSLVGLGALGAAWKLPVRRPEA